MLLHAKDFTLGFDWSGQILRLLRGQGAGWLQMINNISILILVVSLLKANCSASKSQQPVIYEDDVVLDSSDELELLYVDSDDENTLEALREIDASLVDIIRHCTEEYARRALDLFRESYEVAWLASSKLDEAHEDLRDYHISYLDEFSQRRTLNRKFTYLANDQDDKTTPSKVFAAWDSERIEIDPASERLHKVKRFAMIRTHEKIELSEASIELNDYITEQNLISVDRMCAWIRKTLLDGDILNEEEPDLNGMFDWKRYRIPLRDPILENEAALTRFGAQKIPVNVHLEKVNSLFSGFDAHIIMVRLAKKKLDNDTAIYIPWDDNAELDMSLNGLEDELRPGKDFFSLTLRGQRMLRKLVYNQFLIALAYKHRRILVDLDKFHKMDLDPGLVLNVYNHYAAHFGAIKEASSAIAEVVLFLDSTNNNQRDYIQYLGDLCPASG